MKYFTLKFTEKELARLTAGIDSLEGMIGTDGEDFNIEAQSCVDAFDKALTRSNLKRNDL